MPPTPVQNILSPVDFSETSALGLRFASAMAKCSAASLTVLYADQFLPPPYFTHDHLEELRNETASSIDKARRSLGEFAARTLGPEAAFDVRVVEALPVDGILRVARETSANLIAMGTHGRSGFNRLMLGSVTEKVLRASAVPVLTVRPGPANPLPFPGVRNIVCPVNDSEVAKLSLGYAARLADCFHANLTVLHVDEGQGKGSISDLCAWVPESIRSACSVREATREGDAAKEIVAAAAESPCDLLVIGARHRRFFDSTVVGTTTVRVVRHAPCAVLTVTSQE